MTPEDIEAAIRKVLREERDEFWIPQPEHFLDHQMLKECREGRQEWIDNHNFVSSIREGAAWGKKVGIGAVITACVSFLIGAIWLAIKAGLK